MCLVQSSVHLVFLPGHELLEEVLVLRWLLLLLPVHELLEEHIFGFLVIVLREEVLLLLPPVLFLLLKSQFGQFPLEHLAA